MNKFTVGLIGAGSIGGLKLDHLDSPNTEFPLTHAHAVYSDPNFELTWVRDVDEVKAERAADKWNCKIALGFHETIADVIVIASPTSTHLAMIEEISRQHAGPNTLPKVIILEKPAGQNIYEATRIDWLCRESNIQVIVNYGRRFSQYIRYAIEHIQKENDIQSIVFYYTRGFVRDASHAIDILNWVAGTFIEGEIVDTKPILDYNSSDPTYAVRLKYSKCDNIFIVPVDGRKFDCFEMHLLTGKRRWIFDNHFLNISTTLCKKEETYGDYYSLPSIQERVSSCFFETDLKFSLRNLYQHVYKVLMKEEYSSICNMSNALRVHNVIDKLLIDKDRKEKL
ncbi:hypothetical protein A2619_02180 [candidate division WWE3 bacterium RIFOXYD1_FULL_39_9]|uniref:Gfo/Idh/MocA-like oxidoreductase N-terminal domain-containing protein n=1 Tax=candidate division WWE3 bacterium RIFOXYD1_FULL_39_9 TaxID=1802649 RepID=A0A1F4X3G3_UNCKA|nr:MAG: hypothetical protein A2619_02180 [candidate division WWE3 bacterium RIFOXYD1_FULL_39_9]